MLNRSREKSWSNALRLKWLLPLGLAVALVAAVAVAMRPRAVPVYAAPAAEGTVKSYVDERAMTSLPHRHILSMPYDGRLARLEIEEGQRVQAGQVVARLVPEDVDLELAQAQAQVDRITASLAENAYVALELTAKKQAELISQAMEKMASASEFQVTATRSMAEYWQAAADRARQLIQRSAQTIDQLQLAEANEAAREAELTQQQLNAQAQRLMSAATGTVPQLITDYLGRKRLQGDVLKQELAEARVRLESERLRAERATIESPVDGIVLQRRTFSEQFLRAGEQLLEIGQLDLLEVQAEILSQEASHLEVGDPAAIYGPALGRDVENGLPGRVKRIHPDAFTKVSSLGVEQQRVLVDVALEGEARAEFLRLGVGVGYRVRVRIFTEVRDGVLTAPRSALFRNDTGGWSLLVVRAGRAVEQPVEVGLMNDDWVELIQGVSAGEPIVAAPDSELDAGTRVEVLTPALPTSRRSPDE